MRKQKFSYEELDHIIRGYKNGDILCAERLYDAFEEFIDRYVGIMYRYGSCRISDRLTREFIALFMQDRYKRGHIHQYMHMPGIRHEAYKTVENLRRMFRDLERDEIRNELIVTLFDLAQRYQFYDEKPRFHTYVQRAFAYEIKRRMEALIADPVAYRYLDGEDDEDDSEVSSTASYHLTDHAIDQARRISTHKHILIEDKQGDTLNENWINGVTCTEPFETLSKLERRILKLYHQDNLSDQKIADIIGCCRATVNRRRLRAEEKVKDAASKSYAL